MFVTSDCEELKIAIFNTNGLGEFKKRKDVFDFLRKKSGNVFLLQETPWKTGAENVIRSQWGFECIVAGPDCASKGVAVRFKNKLSIKYIIF